MGRILHSRDAAGLVRDDVLEHIADFTRIGKILLPHHLSADDACADLLLRVLFHNVVILLAIEVEDGFEFVNCIIREFEILIETGFQSGIAVNKRLHRFGVARHNDDQVVSVVFHCLKDCVDGFLAEGVVFLCQRVCFINKQNTSHSLLDLFLGLEGGLSDIARHKA